MELKQLYTGLILEYNKDKSNKRKIECPTVHEHGHNPSCGDDIDIEVKIKDGVIEDLAYTGSGCALTSSISAHTTFSPSALLRLPKNSAP